MKSKVIKSEETRPFRPFKIEIEIETIQEARLLYHVFNHGDLREGIMNDKKYSYEGYSEDISCNLTANNTNEKIEIELSAQGFEV